MDTDIHDLLVRYATGIDRRDWAAFRSCFTEDCDADYGDIGHWHGADEITEFMRVAHEGAGHTMHRITNHTTTAADAGAESRCYVDAIIMMADNQSGFRAVGYYDDVLVQTADGWKIARRRFTSVLMGAVDATSGI